MTWNNAEYHLTIQNYHYTDTKSIFHKYEITVSGIVLYH